MGSCYSGASPGVRRFLPPIDSPGYFMLLGGDMQQDRSTGWRLGTNRNIQFRFQATGITMGSVMSVALARLFTKAYPIQAGRHGSRTAARVTSPTG